MKYTQENVVKVIRTSLLVASWFCMVSFCYPFTKDGVVPYTIVLTSSQSNYKINRLVRMHWYNYIMYQYDFAVYYWCQ